MALINCPECNKEVSDKAKICPNCGFSISDASNDVVRIKIDQHPQLLGQLVTIKDVSGNILVKNAHSGSIVDIPTKDDITIVFYTGLGITPMCLTKVSPKNGGKYRASWGAGIFSPQINSCSKVDVLDS